MSATNSSNTTTIIDNDFPEWSIQGPTVVGEGTDAAYTIALDGVFQAGEVVSVDLSLTRHRHEAVVTMAILSQSVNAAVNANANVTFDPATGTLTYTAPADGATMADLIIELPITADGISEAPEDFNIALADPSSSTGVVPVVDPTADDVTTTINGSPITTPDNFFTNINTPLVGNVVTNDSDPDGDVLMVTEVNGLPIGPPIVTDCGTVEMNANGSFIFTPFPGFAGVDTFEYTVVDEFGNEETETVTITINEASIGSAKSVGDAVANGDNFDLPFTIVVENLGNVALDNLTVLDDVAAQFGPAFVATGTPTIQNFSGSGVTPTISSNWLGDTSQNLVTGGRLEAGASFEITFTITIDPDAAISPADLSNQAMVSGAGVNPDGTPMTDASGNPIVAADDSDNGSDPEGENGNEESVDGVAGNDVTGILIADLGIAKAVVGEPVLTELGNFVVTYRVVVENTGTVDLAELSLLEDLTNQFGPAFVNAGKLTLTTPPADAASSISVDSAMWNGSSQIELIDTLASNLLVVGDSFAIEFDVEIDPSQVAGSVGNQIEGAAAAVDASGNPLLDSSGNQLIGTDLSDSGTDPGSSNPDDPSDMGTSDDSSLFTPPEAPLGEIFGVVFVDTNGNGVRDLGEAGIPDVEITLTGEDVFGNSVEFIALTGPDGRYTFGGLNAGTYTVTQTQPDGFVDGLESGNESLTIGDDVISNIRLGFGETVDSGSFAERLPGVTGNPPNLPTLGRLSVSPISQLLNGFLGSRSTIYSGIPINSNANPLSFDSGRAVTGGYALETDWQEGCGCPESIDAFCEADVVDANGQSGVAKVQAVVSEEVAIPVGAIMDSASLTEAVESDQCDGGEAEVVCEPCTKTDLETVADQAHDCLSRPSFLNWMRGWLRAR